MYTSRTSFSDKFQLLTSICVRASHPSEERIIPHLYRNVNCSVIINHEPVTVTIDGRSQTIPANCCCIYNDSCYCWYHGKGTHWNGSWLQGNSPLLQQLVKECGLPWNQPFPLQTSAIVDHYLLLLTDECTGYCHPDLELIRALLRCLFLELGRAWRTRNAPQPRIPETFRKLHHYLDENFTDGSIRLEHLGQMAFLDTSYLSRKFRQYYHISPIAYLRQQRLNYAVELLRNTALPVKDIALQAGFRDLSHLSRSFRQHFGSPPSSFRASGFSDSHN